MTARMLVVCTGSVCRSPATVALLRAQLDDAEFAVQAAGARALTGHNMDPLTAASLAALGLQGDGATARPLTAAGIAEADLVIGLAREHRTAVVTLVPSAVRRTFTLLELTRLLAAAPAPTAPHPLTPEQRIRELITAATAVRPLAEPGEDDVPDPYGRPLADHQHVVSTIADAVSALARRLQVSR